MSSAKLAEEIVVKRSDETKKANMNFERELSSSETISSVSDTTITPSGELTAIPANSDTIVQYTLGSGLPEKSFVALASTDILTATAHGFSNGHPVHVFEDNAENLPGGLSEKIQYYVINKTTDTLQLALTVDGEAVSITSDGQGKIGVDYTVRSTIITSDSQTIVGEGICRLRD